MGGSDFSLRGSGDGSLHVSDGCGLTKTQRMYGFGICFGLGCIAGAFVRAAPPRRHRHRRRRRPAAAPRLPPPGQR